MIRDEFESISCVVENYFNGIYTGDVLKLKSVFHPDATLFGNIQGKPYQKSVAEYLDGVKNRKSPSELNEPFSKKMISLEILGSIAVARLHVPILGYFYHDYLSFFKQDGSWLIVNKLFIHNPLKNVV